LITLVIIFSLFLLVHRAVAFGVGGFVLAPQSLDREKSLSAALVNRQTKKDPLAPSQKVLIRHKKSASTIDAQLPFEKV
jgi:energy-converting hydrogenase Eha subunit F